MSLFGWFLICSAAADSVLRTSSTNPDSWAASSPARSTNAANSSTGPESQLPCGRPGPPECPRRPLEIVGLLDSVSQGSVRHRREAGRGAYPTTTATGRPSAQRCDSRFSHWLTSRAGAALVYLFSTRTGSRPSVLTVMSGCFCAARSCPAASVRITARRLLRSNARPRRRIEGLLVTMQPRSGHTQQSTRSTADDDSLGQTRCPLL